jgi:NADH:ubiquinone oxidoreductase subunit 5 (subunit L)/multisubunit Na+/H+ antiporter MnhA subunit
MRLGARSISQISGLYSRMPVAATGFFVGLLAVTGIPPFSCFWSKLALVFAILKLAPATAILISVPFYLEIVLTFFWFLRVGQRVLFGAPSPIVEAVEMEGRWGGPWLANAVIVTLVVLTLSMPAIVYPFVAAF